MQSLTVCREVPIFFPPDTSSQLYVPGLEGDTLCMDGQKVGILHYCYEVILGSLVEGLDGFLCPPEWAFVGRPPSQTFIRDLWGIPPCWSCHPHRPSPVVPGILPKRNFSHDPAMPNNNIQASFDTHDIKSIYCTVDKNTIFWHSRHEINLLYIYCYI